MLPQVAGPVALRWRSPVPTRCPFTGVALVAVPGGIDSQIVRNVTIHRGLSPKPLGGQLTKAEGDGHSLGRRGEATTGPRSPHGAAETNRCTSQSLWCECRPFSDPRRMPPEASLGVPRQRRHEHRPETVWAERFAHVEAWLYGPDGEWRQMAPRCRLRLVEHQQAT